MIWIEKYRPSEFSQVVGLPHELEGLVGQEMPHLLLSGPAGTGKTTVGKIIAKKLNADCLVLNASDERGIDVIRNKIKTFASSLSSNKKIKIVFLDEGDMLTPEAQTALRNMMESYAKVTRFIITCNYPNKIIDPIKSRCVSFDFGKLEKTQTVTYLADILKQEGVTYKTEDLKIIVDEFHPDVRACVNIIQRCSKTKELKLIRFDESREVVQKIAAAVLASNFSQARKLAIEDTVDLTSLYSQLFDELVDKMDSKELSIITAKYLYWQGFSADPLINFSAYLAELVKKTDGKPVQ